MSRPKKSLYAALMGLREPIPMEEKMSSRKIRIFDGLMG